MPHTKSAKKRLKQDEKRRIANKSASSTMKSAIKKLLLLVDEGKLDEAKAALPQTMQKIDKAAKRRVIHENNASRKKSRVSRAIQGLETKT